MAPRRTKLLPDNLQNPHIPLTPEEENAAIKTRLRNVAVLLRERGEAVTVQNIAKEIGLQEQRVHVFFRAELAFREELRVEKKKRARPGKARRVLTPEDYAQAYEKAALDLNGEGVSPSPEDIALRAGMSLGVKIQPVAVRMYYRLHRDKVWRHNIQLNGKALR